MDAIKLQGVSKAYKNKQVLDNLDLTLNAGTFNVIFGGPASGKSVLLRLIMGLEKPDSGHIMIRDTDASSLLPAERNIGYIPQSFALYPHYNVYDNIAYPLSLARLDKASIKPIVENAADLLKITHLLSKKPNQLSGGEKQRVAIARGIVKDTELYIFDDPLTGLDFKLREQLFDDFKLLRETLNATFIYTTSDALEALMVADEIAALADGKIVEQGTVEDVYYHPQHMRTLYSLGFPPATLMEGALETRDGATVCQTHLFDFPVSLDTSTPPSNVMVGIRPQHLNINEAPVADCLTAEARILLREDLGSELVIYLDKEEFTFEAVFPHAKDHLITSDEVTVHVDPRTLLIFDPQSGMKIGQGTV